MENQKATVEFKTSKGANVVVTTGLRLRKTNYADGWNVEVDCCEMETVRATIDGFPDQAGFYEFSAPKKVIGMEAVAAIGKLVLNAENAAKVKAIIAKMESHPAWVVKQAAIDKNMKEIAEMEAVRDRNGYCRKCGSYCYGDCDAN